MIHFLFSFQPEMLENYQSIKLKPEQFQEYLLSDQVGFESFEQLGIPRALSKGIKFEQIIV